MSVSLLCELEHFYLGLRERIPALSSFARLQQYPVSCVQFLSGSLESLSLPRDGVGGWQNTYFFSHLWAQGFYCHAHPFPLPECDSGGYAYPAGLHGVNCLSHCEHRPRWPEFITSAASLFDFSSHLPLRILNPFHPPLGAEPGLFADLPLLTWLILSLMPGAWHCSSAPSRALTTHSEIRLHVCLKSGISSSPASQNTSKSTHRNTEENNPMPYGWWYTETHSEIDLMSPMLLSIF